MSGWMMVDKDMNKIIFLHIGKFKKYNRKFRKFN